MPMQAYQVMIIVLFLIIAYIVVNSFCIQNFGLVDYRSVIINTIFSIVWAEIMAIYNYIAKEDGYDDKNRIS